MCLSNYTDSLTIGAMKSPIILTFLGVVISLAGVATAKEKKPAGPAAPVGWLNLQSGSRKLSVSEEDLQKVTRNLPRGALLPVFKTKERRGVKLAQVGAINLETGSAELGWLEMNPGEVKPPESYPTDDSLLQLLGAPYLDDFTAQHTDIARFLVRRTGGPAALLCYVVTVSLEMAKLVVFTPGEGTYSLGAALNVSISDIHAGISSIEIRDLVGDGNDCVITKEPFRGGAQTSGTGLLIREILNGQFQILWQAPLEFRNLSQFNPKIQVLQPPERNIGAPGTVTTGDVSFRPMGKGQEPVWKGKVEFFAFGREKAAQSVNIEKVCPWEGSHFAPLH